MKTALNNSVAEAHDIWFKDLLHAKALPRAQVKEVLNALQQCFQTLEFDASRFAADLHNDQEPRIIILSAGNQTQVALTYLGQGHGIIAAIESAFKQMNKKWLKNYNPTLFRVSFVTSADPQNIVEYTGKLEASGIKMGMAFAQKSGVALLPEQLKSWGVITDSKISSKRLYKCLGLDGDKLAKFDMLTLQDHEEGYGFGVDEYVLNGAQIIRLSNGHHRFEEFELDDLKNSIEMSAKYLANSISASGKFMYYYEAEKDFVSSDYGMIRHIGACYALAEYIEKFPNPEYQAALDRAISFLANYAAPDSLIPNSYCIMNDGAYSHLGSQGLGALAFAKYLSLKDNEYCKDILRGFTNWIIESADEKGNFKYHKRKTGFAHDGNDYFCQYYPGEAMFGMMRASKILGDESLAQHAIKIAKTFVASIRQQLAKGESQSTDHWLLYSLSEILAYYDEPELLSYLVDLVNFTASKQIENEEYTEYNGAFSKSCCSSATSLEGLVAAYRTLKKRGYDEKYLHRLKNTLKKGACFQMRNQFLPESSMFLEQPQRALGGFKQRLTEYKLRNDYTQHNLSGLLGLYSIVLD